MRNLVAREWSKIIEEEFRRVNEKKAQAMEILAGEFSDFSTSPQVSVSWCSSLKYSLLCYSLYWTHDALANRYQGPNEFVDDARTVFLNCEEFNEDDSEVSHVKSEWRH